MASEGEFPKADGDILYASEVNNLLQYPKVLVSGATGSASFVVNNGSNWIFATAKTNDAYSNYSSSDLYTWNQTLYINGSAVDTSSIRTFVGYQQTERFNVNLAWSGFVTAGSNTIGISGNSLTNTKIFVIEMGRNI